MENNFFYHREFKRTNFRVYQQIENFINLNRISREQIVSIKHNEFSIILYFYFSGKLNFDFREPREINYTNKEQQYFYPCDKNFNDNMANKGYEFGMSNFFTWLNSKPLKKEYLINEHLDDYREMKEYLEAFSSDLKQQLSNFIELD